MGISISTRQAYSEIDSFLELLNEEERNKIPENLRNIFKQEKDKDYIKKIDVSIPISKQNLKEETLALIALLNLKYWCEDENEKERLRKIYNQNEEKYNKIIDEKSIDSNDIFKTNNVQEDKIKQELVEYTKYPLYKKIFKKIKGFFCK